MVDRTISACINRHVFKKAVLVISCGLWKMPYLRKSAEKRGFPQILGKAFGFPTFPTGSDDDFFNLKVMGNEIGNRAVRLRKENPRPSLAVWPQPKPASLDRGSSRRIELSCVNQHANIRMIIVATAPPRFSFSFPRKVSLKD